MVIAPGEVLVSAYADGFVQNQATATAVAGQTTTVNLRLERLPPDSVVVRGRVTDAASGDPIANADVSLYNPEWGHWNSTRTDAGGAYEFRTKPGYSILTISAYKFYWGPCDYAVADSPSGAEPAMIAPDCSGQEREHEYFPRSQSFSAAADETMTIDAELPRAPEPDAEFVGWVVNASSNDGIEGAVVSFYNERTHDWGQAVTDADGSYRIRVHAGYYTIRAYADGHFEQVANAEVASGATKHLDLALQPGESRYGHGCCYTYGGIEPQPAMGAPDASGEAAGGPPSDSPSAGGEGAQRYAGQPGGLGQYDPNADLSEGDSGGGAPGAPLALLVAGILAMAILVRRRRA
jgi:protocatechuate 3,4-dioxygenase beta subunit